MKTSKYLILCAAVTVVTALTILFVPGVSDTIESELLSFLAANAN